MSDSIQLRKPAASLRGKRENSVHYNAQWVRWGELREAWRRKALIGPEREPNLKTDKFMEDFSRYVKGNEYVLSIYLPCASPVLTISPKRSPSLLTATPEVHTVTSFCG